jgi:probable addiction module antidote protein
VKTEYEPFDVAADYLVSEERIAGYLSAAAEDEDPNVLLLALCDAAKARGMMEVAKAAGLNRESLYKALKPGAHPRFETVQAVLRALGVKLAMSARAGEARAAAADAGDDDPLSPSWDNGKDLSALVTEQVALIGADKSALAQVEEIAARTPTLSIDAFRPTHQPKTSTTAAEEITRKAAAKKAALKKARAEAAKPATPAKKHA